MVIWQQNSCFVLSRAQHRNVIHFVTITGVNCCWLGNATSQLLIQRMNCNNLIRVNTRTSVSQNRWREIHELERGKVTSCGWPHQFLCFDWGKRALHTCIPQEILNPLTPKDPYNGCTAPLTSKRFILYIYSTNTGTEYFKHGIYSVSFASKCSLFHNSNIFGSCFIHILYTVCAKF